MSDFLYGVVEAIANIHSLILSLNDAYEYNFSDKELHFIVIGALGILLVLAIYPLFKLMARNGHIMAITWIYVFTLILVLTFAIEIGQKVSGTGVMDFADVVFGVFGFIVIFAIFDLVRLIIKGIAKLIKGIFE